MFNLLVALMLAVIAPPCVGAAGRVPDFDYPKTVMKDADKSLDRALQKGNHADVVKYLVQSTLAEAQISSDNIPGILGKIDSVAAIETDSAAVGLMHYLKAVVYGSYFSNNSYAISQRKPVDGRAADMSEWTQADFIGAVTECLGRSLEYADALWATPVTDYVEADELSAAVYPTLLDMVTYRGIDVLNLVASYRWTGIALDAREQADKFKADAMAGLVERHRGDAAPYITAMLKCASADSREVAGKVAKSLYEEYSGNEFCYLALEAYLPTIYDNKQKHSLLNDYIARFPGSPFVADARNGIAQLERKSVNLTYSSAFTSADSITVKVEAGNVGECRVRVYRVPDGVVVNNKLVADRSKLQLVAEATARLQGAVPFADTVEVKMKPLPYGRYIILPDYEGLSADKSIYPQEFRVTDITLFHVKSSGGVKVFAVNSINGKPLKDVYVNKANKYDMAQPGRIAANRTNADGYCLIKKGDSRLRERVAAMRGDDRYGMGMYVSEFNLYEAEPENIDVFTDLGVYRPGDTVRYSAICYRIDRNSRQVTAGLPVEVTLRDQNYEDVATDSLVTDEFGRIAGEFVIPADRLNGLFCLEVNGDNVSGIRHFPVSEYKTPTFFVEFDGEQRSYARNADVTLTGRAEYFTGVPVAGAKVALTLGYQSWNWWYRFINGNSTHISDYAAETDADGRFSITIPGSVLNGGDLPARVQFSLESAITDDAGETQSATKLFWLGDTRVVELTGGNYTFEVSEDITTLPVTVRSSNPADTALLCNYTLAGRGSLSGSFSSSKPSIDFSSLPSGKYSLKVAIDGDTATKPLETEIVIFRDTDVEPPVDSPLWIPDCRLAVGDDNVASLLLGNSVDDAHIYYVAASKKGVVKESWLEYGKGMHRFTIDVPQAEDEYIDLTFVTVRDKVTYTWNHRFESRMHRDTLRIMPIAFRDNLVPGTPETWTFKLVNQAGQLRRGAMLCDMYDKALDMIAAHSWNFTPQGGYGMVYSVGTYYAYPTNLYTSVNFKLEKTQGIQLPDLDFYGRNYAGRIRVRGSSSFRTLAKGAAPMMNGAMMAADEVASVEELAVSDSGSELQEVVVVTTEDSQAQLDNVVMRAADVRNALWRPSLTTAADGTVSVTFNSPQFNTTWLFKAIAYTQDLHTASMVREVVTRKPVMVRAALPRFVRNGDRATLSSMLMNATDSVQQCTAIVELFDVATGETIVSQSFARTLEGNGSTSLDIEWDVPAEISMVGYRVKAATAEFGDGEQHLLTVLPSVSPVVETEPFYLLNNMTYELTLDGSNKKDRERLAGRMVLEFCNNPTWYCVTALPSIMQDDYLTANGLAHSLYAIAVAQGIAATDPGIKEAVDAWLADESDSTLVSNLAKNGDLKIGTLLASPWVKEADRQTLRMQQIGLLFDSAAVATETAKIVGKLRDLQMADGGWTWLKYAGCTTSPYVTQQVLQLIGELQHLGYLKDNIDINAMVKKAVAYIDRRAVEDYYRLSNKDDLSGFYGYAYVRALFPGEEFAGSAESVFKAVIKYMKWHWDAAAGLGDKAWCAMTLYRNGEKKTAGRIMESVRQYGIEGHNGTYWDNFSNGSDRGAGRVAVTATLLQAFGEVCADDTEYIDGIRQWMLLQKQSTDWGNCSLAADAVYSILSTGSDWLGRQPEPSILLNGKPMEYESADFNLGYFRKEISPDGDQLSLYIDRRGAASPAWGAVYCQYSAKMDGIKAVKTDDISVEKQICKLDGGELDRKAALAVGDKVLVRLVIKNSRDLQFVTLNDERAACCEPADQLSGYRYADGVGYYLETKDSATRLFFNYLPKGTHVITYETVVTSPGSYNVGIATVQSQYAPQIVAHSAGSVIEVK